MGSLRIRRILLMLSILLLTVGLVLVANATIMPRQTNVTSRAYASSVDGLTGHYFTFIGGTLSPDTSAAFTLGTTGVADIIVLKTPIENFSQYLCPGTVGWHCWGDYNVTILQTYLQTHKSEIAYSQTITSENMTLDLHVTGATKLTVVLLPVGEERNRVYLDYEQSNQTTTYPMIGWTERPGSIWNLANISTVIVSVGLLFVAGTIIAERRRGLD